jgi:solute carrier family 25 (mitochondrial carnitine/acylcarnitine transporter), member 20/29
MQTALPSSSGSESSSSMFQTLVHTFRASGVRGLYRGVSAPLLAAAFVFAVSFWGYDTGQRIIRYWTHHSHLTLLELCLAGGISGVPSALLMAPSERIKILMQTDSRYTTMLACGLEILREGGVRSLMRGTLLTLCRDVPGSMAWFGTYEYVKHLFMMSQGHVNASRLPPVVILFAGGLAGTVYWMVSMPVDVLKSRLQSAPEGTYSGVMDVFVKVMRAEGPAALFKGTAPALMRAFPANAACFYGMEVSKQFLDYLEAALSSPAKDS